MSEAYIIDAIRTPRGKGKKDGSLHEVKPISLLTGLPAKEAIVSTMGILYHTTEEGDANLATVLREEKVFTPANSWAFMLFVLLYFPCVATVSTLRKEVGAKWAGFVVVNSLVLAWVCAFLAFRIIGLFI